jgi:hypothetical protein
LCELSATHQEPQHERLREIVKATYPHESADARHKIGSALPEKLQFKVSLEQRRHG